ncbi:MAG: cytochrome P450 [Actinomycetales bacterium]|nr:cytochrome P450 [Actinomycetales bacterium]
MTWTAPPGTKNKYGWNTPVTAPGPDSRTMLSRLREIQSNPLNFLTDAHQQHGEVVQFPIPKPAAYSISSAELARQVLVDQHREVSKNTVQYSTLALVTGEGLLTADTETWKTSRRQLAPAFHHQMIDLAQNQVASALTRLEEKWRDVTETGSAIIDVDQAMMNLALEITGTTLFGTDLSGQVDKLTAATLRALHGVVKKARSPLPIPLAIPTPANIGMRAAIGELDRAVEAIINQRLANPLPEDAPIRDMLDVLLDTTLEVPLTHRQVRDEVATFIVAGHETIASALTWAWQLLGTNPEELLRLKEDPNRAELVFDEALRLYPPAWVITRRTLTEISLTEFLIPADSVVIVSPWVVHRNPNVWTDPTIFRPDRFIDGAPKVGYFPFGAGPRLCIGRDLARLQGAQILSRLATNWQLTPIHNLPIPIDASVTLRPHGGMPMRLSRS